MNRDYPMQTTVGGEDAPILGSVLPFPEEEEGEPKMDGFPMQTTVGGEEKSDFEDFFFFRHYARLDWHYYQHDAGIYRGIYGLRRFCGA